MTGEGDVRRTVLIIGAAGGLGRALALYCGRQGAQVLLVGRTEHDLVRLCEELELQGAPAPGYCGLDLALAGPDAFRQLVDDCVEAYGAVHGLAHCAVRFEGLRPLDQVPEEEWLRTIQVNLNATWLLTRCCLPALRASGDGRVAFVHDGARAPGSPFWGPYGVSKSAVEELARMFEGELEGTGCVARSFAPGPMRTALRARAFHAEDPQVVEAPDAQAELIGGWLLNRF